MSPPNKVTARPPSAIVPSPTAKPLEAAHAQKSSGDGLKTQARKEVRRALSRPHDFETVQIREPIRGTDEHLLGRVDVGGSAAVLFDNGHNVVTRNPDRVAAAERDEKLRWTQLTLGGKAGLEGTVGDVDTSKWGFGAALGVSRGYEVEVIVPASIEKGVTEGARQALEDHKDGALVKFDPEKRAAKLAPGSEVVYRSTPLKIEARLGYSVNTDEEPIEGSAFAGVKRARAENVGEKRLLVGRDQQVTVSVRSYDENRMSAGIDGKLRTNIPIDPLPNINVTVAKLHAGPSLRSEKGVELAGTYDLKTPEGRDIVKYLMELDPNELRDNPERVKAEVAKRAAAAWTDGKVSEAGISAGFSVGPWDIFDAGRAFVSTSGVTRRVGQGKEEELESFSFRTEDYRKWDKGILPKYLDGEERDVSVRIGGVKPEGQQEEIAALFSAHIRDRQVGAAEHAHIERFITAMGLAAAPARKDSGGKGSFAVEAALDRAGLTKLARAKKESLEAQFDMAFATLNGGVPPWKDDRKGAASPHYDNEQKLPLRRVRDHFVEAVALWKPFEVNPNQLGDQINQKRADVERDYRVATGRDLLADLASYAARHEVSEQLAAANASDLKAARPFLRTVGQLSSADLRTTLLMLKNAGGASVTSLYFKANGVDYRARAAEEPAAPATKG